MKSPGLAALLVAFLPAPPLQAQPSPGPAAELGRLFYTPGERADIERERGKPSRGTAATEGPERVVVSGVIVRRGGAPVPLVNGRALAPGESLSGLIITGLSDGRVRVTRAMDGRSGLARPGQTVDLATGEVREPFDSRESRSRDTPSPQGLPYTAGVPAPVAEKAVAVRSVKAKRPRRAKRPPKSAPVAAPPQSPHAAPPAAPVTPMGAPGPGIPATPR